jgi:hypothetical protein
MITIAKAAIELNGSIYTMPRPFRHGHIIYMMVHEYMLPAPINGRQNFVTNTHRFVTREDAAVIALHAGQIKGHRKQLFSEDLW